MRQILYVSSRSPKTDASVGDILRVSRRNNAEEGVTGLLWTDGGRFLQVLEGDADVVQATFDRIYADPRHRAVVILSDRQIKAREFGEWAMAHRLASDTVDQFDQRLDRMLAGTSETVRGTFVGLIEARRAAHVVTC